MLDREQALQQGMERTMLGAMALVPYISYKVYGSALAPKDMFNPKVRLDNIERYGTTGKPAGSPPLGKPPEAVGGPGGQPTGAGKTAKIGDDFGKLGVVIENPGIKADWTGTSTHGKERMTQRGVTQDMMDTWLETGKVLEQKSGNYIFITEQGAAVFNKAGKLITTYTSADYDDAMWAVVRKLFGE